MKEQNEQLELMVDLIDGLLIEEGFNVLKFRDTNGKKLTTAYEAMEITDYNGNKYSITIDLG